MYFDFKIPAPIIFGVGAISVLGEKVKGFGCKKILIVTEKPIEDAGIVAYATRSLDAADIGYAIYNGVVADPHDALIDEAYAVAKREGCDGVVGIGGGSSLDAAKATSILFEKPGPAKQYINAVPIFIDTKTPLVLVPTTAGTGSECTTVAVISRPEMNGKWSVWVNSTLAIVDPELTLSVPKSVTATTGLDALAHSMEGMTTVLTNVHSDLFAVAAIEKIFKYLPICCDDPGNIEARTQMAMAANFGGLAFTCPLVHVGHALADAMSVHLHTPHGYNCALALPEAMCVIAPGSPDRIRTIAKAIGLSLTGKESPEELGKMVADAIRGLMRKVGIKTLKEMGIDRGEFLTLAADAAGNFLATLCPVKIDEPLAEKLLAGMYDNY